MTDEIAAKARELLEVAQAAPEPHLPVPATGRKLPRGALGMPPGEVSGAWSIKPCQDPLLEPSYLDAGERMQVPAGRAVRVQQGDGWLTFEFPHQGSLVGPLVWGWVEATSRSKLEEAHLERVRDLRWSIPFVAIGLSCTAAYAMGPIVWNMTSSGPLTALGVVAGIVMPPLPWLATGWLDYHKAAKTIDEHGSRVNMRIPLSASATALLAPKAVADMQAPMRAPEASEVEMAYAAARAELRNSLAGADLPPSLLHVEFMIEQISGLMRAAPLVSGRQELQAAYKALLVRVTEEMRKVASEKAAAISTSIMGDISALLQQVDRRG